MTPRRIGFIGYDGMTALDLVGPMEAFASALLEDEAGRPASCYETVVLGLTERAFRAASGLVIKPDAPLARAPKLDTLIVPGGMGLREDGRAAAVAEWVLAEGK